jgi:amino acid adenylation domain-containing protein
MSETENAMNERSGQDKRALLARLLREKAGRVKYFPPSFAQQRLWLLHQFEPLGPLYHMIASVRLRGELDLSALRQAFTEIIRRHESLRTTFAQVNGDPMQVVHPAKGFDLQLVDLVALPAGAREAEAGRAVSESSKVSFDLNAGPLLRVMLVRLEESEHVLLLTMHHIVSDGWSMNVLAHEVGVLYQAFSQGLPSPLAELPIQYADFSRWQRERLSGEVLEAHLDYWRRHLDGELPLLELPTDRPRPAVRSLAGSTCGIVLPKALSEQLRALSRSERVTMFMLMLAAFKTLLYRYTGQPDIIVGTPTAGRDRIETESLIGFFINMVMMRSDLSDNPSFREFLGRLKEVALGAYAHQEMPFDRLVDELNVNRRSSQMPLFQVVFDLRTATQNNEAEKTKLEGLKWNTLESDVRTARFDLTLNMTETGEGITGSIEYRTDLFDEATIQRMLSHFQNLLQAIVSQPDRPLSELPLLSDEESRRLLCDFNPPAPAMPPAACLHQLFEAQASRFPDSPALSCEGRHLSYGEVNARANRLAHHLRSLGVRTEDRVALLLDRTPDLVIAILGILKAGAAYLPLDPAYPAERLSYMLADAGAQVIVTEQAQVEPWLLEQSQAALVCLDDQALTAASDTNLDAAAVGVRAENAAYVIYTSGSTGQPKGVVVTHENVWRLLEVTRADFEFDASDVWTLFHSVCFDFSVWELWGALVYGGRLVVVPYWVSREPEAFYELLREERVTVLNQTPSAFRQLMKVDEAVGGELGLRVVIFGGEALEMSTLRGWFERHGEERPRLVNMYGITETTVHVTYRELSARDTEGGSVIGGALGDLTVYVLDEQMRAVPEGISGELYVGGAGVARGYLGRAELTAERFVPDLYSEQAGARLYRTGDLAKRRADGELEYLGRLDEQVKIRGFRIELGEIANALREETGVRECVVVALGEGGGEQRIVAYVVADQEAGEVNAGELRGELKKRLPEHMIPAAIVMLEELPLTRNGKVDRRALPAPEEVWSEEEAEFVAPRTPVEEVLAGIWSDVLRTTRIGVNDDFFELGGHSLLATKMISRVREAFQVDIQHRALYEAPTVAGLAEVVELAIRSRRGVEIPPFERVSREETLPLSFAQQRLWFLYQLEPDSPAYNVPVSVRLQGALDTTALEQSLNETLRRHEVLRTTFPMVAGEPVQVISPPAPLDLRATDLSWLPDEKARLDEARRLATVETEQLFDLTNGPLFRAKLLRLSEDDHVLVLTMHHIASDGWSMGILVNEVTTLYRSYSEGQPSTLAELPIQYADFAHWQRNWLDGEVLSQQLNYWKEQLSGAAPLELPTDRPRPPVLSYRGAVETLLLEKGLAESLRELSQRQGVTMFMLLLAAFKVLLMRYTGQEDISVGSPISGRNWTEIEGLIGFFVNTLVLRTEMRGEESFEELVRRVREIALDGYAHQDVPFEKLVEEIRPERDASRQPLFQVIFRMQNANAEAVESSGLTLSSIGTENRTAKFDLNLLLTETSSGIDAALEYKTDLFDASTVARLLCYFRNLLAGIVSNPKQAVSALPLLGEDERRLILHDVNNTSSPFPSHLCLHQLFEAQVERTPAVTALVFGEQRLSYRELDERANELARYLRRLGVSVEQPVGICLSRSAEMIVAMLGVLKAGGVYVPLDVDYPRARLLLMVEDTGLRVVVTSSELRETMADIGARLVEIDTEAEAIAAEGRARLESTQQPGGERLAYIIYTSGSTGRPKGVAVSQSAVSRLVFNTNYVQLNASDRIAQASNATFDAATFEIWGALLHGACLVGISKDITLSPQEFAAQLRDERITTIFLTTALFNQLASTVPEAFAALRHVMFGGEAVDPKWVREVLEKGAPERLLHVYGPTESTTFALWHLIKHVEENATTIPIGKPISNTQVYLLDQNLRPAPVGADGELYLGGEGLARDYCHCPDTTAEKFIPNPFGDIPGARLYRTGDLARFLPDGDVQFIGRIDHQVKVRGFRIELGEIEAVLSKHPDVQECTVLAREDSPGERRLVAYLVAQPEASALTASELRLYLQEKLPDYMIPTSFVRLDALPLTRNGKVDRRALPSPEHERMALVGEYVAPRSSLEEVLAEIWGEVLKVERVGIHDNFFSELGGHSLLATQMVVRVRNAFELDLPLRHAFQSPTIAELATTIETIILDEVEELTDSEVLGQVHEAQMSIAEKL